MKYFTKFYLVAIFLMVSFAANAQSTNIDSWLKYQFIPIHTQFLLDENFQMTPYTGKELRAGILNTVISLHQYAELPFSPDEAPEGFYFKFSFSNPYHTKDVEGQNDFQDFLGGCVYGDSYSDTENFVEDLFRGGQYQYIAKFPALGIDENSTVILYDEPNFRKSGCTSCQVGKTDSLYRVVLKINEFE